MMKLRRPRFGPREHFTTDAEGTVWSLSRAGGCASHSTENDEEQGQRPADCLVTEMLQCLPTETVYVVAHFFEKRFK